MFGIEIQKLCDSNATEEPIYFVQIGHIINIKCGIQVHLVINLVGFRLQTVATSSFD